MKSIRVKSLHCYPVKSCKGIDLESGKVVATGFEYDRTFMLVDEEGNFLSQRKLPLMALITVEISDGKLNIQIPGIEPVVINPKGHSSLRSVTVWGDDCSALDMGEAVASKLSDFLGMKCQLVMMAPDNKRTIDPVYAISDENRVSFSDGYPFLLISQESLNDLNSRMEERLPMNRFRPNIVVEGCGAYDEDTWQKIQIGEVVLEIVKPSVRCAITTVNQQTAARGKEPLRTLASYRNIPGKGVIFGQNIIHHNIGQIHIGQDVKILEYKK